MCVGGGGGRKNDTLETTVPSGSALFAKVSVFGLLG